MRRNMCVFMSKDNVVVFVQILTTKKHLFRVFYEKIFRFCIGG